MIDTISIREAARILKYKKNISVETWCKNHNLPMFSDQGKKYLIQSQFEYVRLKKFIEYLKLRYCNNWFKAFKAYQEMDIIRMVDLEEQSEIKPPIFYIPQNLGEHEKACLARLHKIINELPSNTDGKSIVYSEK